MISAGPCFKVFQDYNSKCMKTSKFALNPRFGQLQYAYLCDHDPTGRGSTRGKKCYEDGGQYQVTQRYSANTLNGKSYRHIEIQEIDRFL